MKKPSILKKLWDSFTTVVVVLFVLAAVFLLGSRLIGYDVYNVISGSMEPTFSKGDLIYVKAVDVNSIKEGTPITFVANEQLTIATHRVVRVDKENRCFYTKGDANDVEDQKPVRFENVKGVPQFAIPLLGYVSDYIGSPPGTYVAIAVVVIPIGVAFVPDMFAKKKPQEAVLEAPAEPVAPAPTPVESAEPEQLVELASNTLEVENIPGQTNEGGNQL